MRSILIALLLAPLGCQERPAAEAMSARDSAGVAIVQNSPRRLTELASWPLSTEPVLRIGSDSLALFEITDADFLAAGEMVVLSAGTSEMLVFDEGGSLLLRAGAAGDGPGEFRQPNSLIPIGDSVGVYDGRHRRLSIFGAGGSLEREVSFRDEAAPSAWTSLLPLESEGWVLWTNGGLGSAETQGVYRTPSEVLRIDPSGGRRASYGAFPGAEVFVASFGAGAVLFGATSHATTMGDRLVVGTAEAPELRVFRPDGSLERIIRWPDEDRQITGERMAAAAEAMIESVPPAERARARALFEQIPRADRMPAYEGLLSSGTHIWVGGYRGPEMVLPTSRSPRRRWLVFDSAGALTAAVFTPEGFDPLTVSHDRIIGVFKDELGVEEVRMYEIRRRDGGEAEPA